MLIYVILVVRIKFILVNILLSKDCSVNIILLFCSLIFLCILIFNLFNYFTVFFYLDLLIWLFINFIKNIYKKLISFQ